MLAGVRSLFSRVFAAPRSTEFDESLIRFNANFSDEQDLDQITRSIKGVDGKSRRSLTEEGCSSPITTVTDSHRYPPRTQEPNECTRLAGAMQIAISRCNIDTIRRLLDNFQLNLNYRDQYGMTYLEHAILIGHVEIVDLLIRHGCDLSQGKREVLISILILLLLFRSNSGYPSSHVSIHRYRNEQQ